MIYKKEYKNPNTVWEQIKQDIEILIINGTLQNADKVPSISKLSEMYDIGKSTAQKVLEMMYEEGTIIKQKGVGYFVKPYMKEKLREKHMEEVKQGLKECIFLASKLELDKDILMSMANNIIAETYSKQ